MFVATCMEGGAFWLPSIMTKKPILHVPKRIVGSIKNQTFALDIDLDRVRKIREARLKDLKSNFYVSL